MANEAQITSSLAITMRSGNTIVLQYRSLPAAFQATVTGTNGPVPGAMEATVAGVNVDFSELTTPGLCRIMNLDGTNYYEVGIWDPDNSKFFPMLELLPGETYVVRLARSLQKEFQTGTGTTGAADNRLRVKANGAAVKAVIEAFEV